MNDYGHFTTMRVEDDGVRGLSFHAERLRRDAAALFDEPIDMHRCREAAVRAVAASGTPVILRLAVTSAVDLVRPGTKPVLVTATTRVAARAELPPLRVGTVTHTRALPNVKHLGLTADLAVRRTAQQQGHDDALMVTSTGEVAEGPTWSLLLISGRRLVTPAAPTLPSVTLALLDQVDGFEGVAYDHLEDASDLEMFDAALAVNAGWGLRPIASIAHPAGCVEFAQDGPIVSELTAAYSAIMPEPLAYL